MVFWTTRVILLSKLNWVNQQNSRGYLNHVEQLLYWNEQQCAEASLKSAFQKVFKHVLTEISATNESYFHFQCMELQCYIHPLSSILNGLRSGRYRERKSVIWYFFRFNTTMSSTPTPLFLCLSLSAPCLSCVSEKNNRLDRQRATLWIMCPWDLRARCLKHVLLWDYQVTTSISCVCYLL